jgi:hypothetical protein
LTDGFCSGKEPGSRAQQGNIRLQARLNIVLNLLREALEAEPIFILHGVVEVIGCGSDQQERGPHRHIETPEAYVSFTHVGV